MSFLFVPKLTPPEQITTPSLWFIFKDEKLLIDKANYDRPIPLLQHFSVLSFESQIQHYLGTYNETHCFAVELNTSAEMPQNMEFYPLRQCYDILGDTLFNIAGRASQILLWDNTNHFCGRCGAEMYLKETERAKACPKCQLHSYPRISPSIIVLIEKGRDILLARSPHFPPGRYSILAGFIEPGETAEQAVAREVFEEVGIHLKNIQYVRSQPWPFPHSLMLGFTAEYESGEITIDGVEIEDAHWYNIHNLPDLPLSASIARWLINSFIEKQQK
jgi:NAD+ diphosphatase